MKRRTAPRYRTGVPPAVLATLERVMRCGTDKHGEIPLARWRAPEQWDRMLDQHVAAALRHVARSENDYRERDAESGAHHLAHAAARLILALCILNPEVTTFTYSKETPPHEA